MSELPKGWVRASLGTLTDARYGEGFAMKDLTESGFPVFGANGQVGFFSRYTHEESEVLVTCRGATCGTVNISLPNSFVTSNSFIVVPRNRDVLEKSFLRYWLEAADTKSFITGTAQPQITLANFNPYEVPVPPLNEQRRIVAKLEALQARSRRARAALDAVPPLLEKLRQTILAAAFRGDLTKGWRAKNKNVEPAEKLLARIRVERRKKWEEAELAKMRAKDKVPKDDGWKAKYKEPEPVDTAGLPELPVGWCWASLDQLTERITKGSSPNWQGFEYVSDGIPFVRSQNVGWGKLDLSDVANLPEAFNEKEPRSVLREGDVLLNIVGASIGRAALATKAIDGGNTNQAVSVIRPLVGIHGTQVVQWLISPLAQKRMNFDKVDVARANLSLEDVARSPIPLAPMRESVAIERAVAMAVARITKLVSAADGSRQCCAQLDRAILAKAFRGELVPQDPEGEPSESLPAGPRNAHGRGAKQDKKRPRGKA